MRDLFETFKKSIYNPDFYRAVPDAPFKEALRFYAKFVIFLALIMTVAFGVLLVPEGVRFIKERAPELVSEYYPSELVVNIEKGEATVNVEEPYIIPGKGVVLDALKKINLENFIVIDTRSGFDKDRFEAYSSFALLTKSEIVTQSTEGRITIQELPRGATIVVSKETLLGFVEKVRGSLGYIVPAGILATFIILVSGFAVYLIVLFIFALIPFLLAKAKSIPLSYIGAYKMSMYAVMPGLALKSLLNIAGIFFVPAYFVLLVFMLVIFLNMRTIEQPKLFKS